MEDANFLLLVIGFFIGYTIKTFLTFRATWTSTANFVNKMANQSLKLLGTTVSKVAFMDQIYRKAIVMSQGSESAKMCANELDHEFHEWKKQTMKAFSDNYPDDYKWQLEATDWQGAMNMLTDIYKDEKLPDGKE